MNELKCITKTNTQFIVSQLIDAIQHNHPMIISVDFYYLPAKYDMYLKSHFPHAILVIGYSQDEQFFYKLTTKMLTVIILIL